LNIIGEEMRVINGYGRKIGKAAPVGTFAFVTGGTKIKTLCVFVSIVTE
jgi:hypothetical protein